MSANQFIAEFMALPPEQRRKVAESIILEDASWIPDAFSEGVEDTQAWTLPFEKALAGSPLVGK